jgi:SAM-dependent methyltransferase
MSFDRLLRVLPRLPYDPRRHGLYRLNEELVVSRELSVYDPKVFGRYDLETQRVVPRDERGSELWDLDLDALMASTREAVAKRAPRVAGDRYDLVLPLLRPGSGTLLDACTARPEARVRDAVKALGYEYVPIDIDGDGVTVRREDLTRLTFAEDSVACVISLDTLEHIEDYEAALREIHRVLEPGGVAVLHTPCYYVGRPDNVPIDPGTDPWEHVRYFSMRAVVESVAGAGFAVLRVGLQLDYGAVLCVASKP